MPHVDLHPASGLEAWSLAQPVATTDNALPDGRSRAVIEQVSPAVDGGCFAVKRVVGDRILVEADAFTDGHDALSCLLKFRRAGDDSWQETAMTPLVNDRWQGEFVVDTVGRYYYTIEAWVDHFKSWRRDLRKRVDAKQDVSVDLRIGADMAAAAAQRAAGVDGARLAELAAMLRGADDAARLANIALGDELASLMALYPDRRLSTVYEPELALVVDRSKARYSSWYELFPRSTATEPGRHGTLRDCASRIPHIAEMGFDVLYLPPIHPIGKSHRKGPNNAPLAGPDDPGSPWAIGAAEGGHKAIHPELGTFADFEHLLATAREHGVEVALDIAFQCSPDHPYVREHPEWFRKRPDGTIQYAENPPKKYQDIYPFDFECDDWRGLWNELLSVVLFWSERGVRIFRVDNPHTKPFPFWQWLIAETKRIYPDVLFLAEAFTRPKVMKRLAKLGFTQSYTYFTWRNTKAELTEYFTSLTRDEQRDYFGPNLWPNTPDILPEYLQYGGRPAAMARLVLAATLGATYGVYGPPLEALDVRPREPGSEEYLDSEKYQIRQWTPVAQESMAHFMRRLNRIRRENPALQKNDSLQFHTIENQELICYSKQSDDGGNTVLVVVNLDPYHTQSGWLTFPLESVGLESGVPYQVHDLLGDGRFLWSGSRNYVELNPQVLPAHIFAVRRRVRTERQFEYYM